MARMLSIGAFLAALLVGVPAGAQELLDTLIEDLGSFCAKAATMDEAMLNRAEQTYVTATARFNLNDNRNPLNQLRTTLGDARDLIGIKQNEIRDIETKIVEARKAAKSASSLDSQIKDWEGTLSRLQAKRLELHAGAGGEPGIDQLVQRIAEIDRRLAANDFASGPERVAAGNERAALARKLATLLAAKEGLAGEYREAQRALQELKAERDRLNPEVEKFRKLESELEETKKALADLRKSEKKLIELSDKYRNLGTEILLGGDQIRACIADRRKALAAAKPPDQPAPPSAATASFTLNGTWTGKCKVFDAVAGGQFSMSAAAGKISGSFSGDAAGALSGSVDGKGQLIAAGGGGGQGVSVQWRGSVAQSGGRWGGGGSWSSTGGSGGGCSGSWQAR